MKKTIIIVDNSKQHAAVKQHAEFLGYIKHALDTGEFHIQYPYFVFQNLWHCVNEPEPDDKVLLFSNFSDLTGVKVEPEPVRVELEGKQPLFALIFNDRVTFEININGPETDAVNYLTRADITAIYKEFEK